MTRQSDLFDPSCPLNSVEATAKYARVSRGLAYEMARTSQWPALRAGSRLLIKTQPFLKMCGVAEADLCACAEKESS